MPREHKRELLRLPREQLRKPRKERREERKKKKTPLRSSSP